MNREQQKRILILHDIRSAHNVGAIFRTADAFGISKIYCSGYTPAPLDRFNRPQKEIAKTALGAEKTVAWEKKKDIHALLAQLKQEKFLVVAVEQHARAKDYKNFSSAGGIALMLGNEVEGIAEDVLKESDAIISIPMRGKKESLNVSVAAGIVLSRLFDK